MRVVLAAADARLLMSANKGRTRPRSSRRRARPPPSSRDDRGTAPTTGSVTPFITRPCPAICSCPPEPCAQVRILPRALLDLRCDQAIFPWSPPCPRVTANGPLSPCFGSLGDQVGAGTAGAWPAGGAQRAPSSAERTRTSQGVERTCHGYAEVCADTGHDDRVDIEVGELLGQFGGKKPSVAVFRTTTSSPSAQTRGRARRRGVTPPRRSGPRAAGRIDRRPLAAPARAGCSTWFGSTTSTAGRAPG